MARASKGTLGDVGRLARLVAPLLPWADGTGRHWRGWARLPSMAPFTLAYLVVSWALFLVVVEPGTEFARLHVETIDSFRFHIPDLGENRAHAIRSLLAPLLHHDRVQIVYVTVLLVLFGVLFELREGTRYTVLIFVGATFAGALVAGVVLHALYPELAAGAFFDEAWHRTWDGGSAGCFGLMGALAGRARISWPLLLVFALWETGVALFYLKSYTPAFHVTALLVGYASTLLCMRPPLRADRRA
ncbi:MAG: rhomboid family intramembrane serine protease [Dehalococcoidia bacterium]|nr:rhomboid family intramembrane serine protease [Dehalococcoidia bacterium]